MAIIGSYGSSLSMAGGEVAEQYGTMYHRFGYESLGNPGQEILFPHVFYRSFQGSAAAKYAYEQLGVRKQPYQRTLPGLLRWSCGLL